jgi:hypothetical protein
MHRKFRWPLIIAFAVALGWSTFYVTRSVRDFLYWQEHADEPIEGWMTIGFVAHSYHVPPHVLFLALSLPVRPPDNRPLSEIAETQRRSLNDERALLMNAIVHARPPYPPPPPPPPPEPKP